MVRRPEIVVTEGRLFLDGDCLIGKISNRGKTMVFTSLFPIQDKLKIGQPDDKYEQEAGWPNK